MLPISYGRNLVPSWLLYVAHWNIKRAVLNKKQTKAWGETGKDSCGHFWRVIFNSFGFLVWVPTSIWYSHKPIRRGTRSSNKKGEWQNTWFDIMLTQFAGTERDSCRTNRNVNTFLGCPVYFCLLVPFHQENHWCLVYCTNSEKEQATENMYNDFSNASYMQH